MSEAFASERLVEIDRARPLSSERMAPTRAAEVSVFGWRAILATIAGGVLTGWIVFTPLGLDAWQTVDMQQVAFDEIDRASQSLVAASAAGLVESAKACSRPLGFLTIQPTRPGGWIRFRSGAYTSPKLRLERPERIALPFPAPYETGQGQIIVENESGGAAIFLRPAVVLDAGPGTNVIRVHWTPKTTCR